MAYIPGGMFVSVLTLTYYMVAIVADLVELAGHFRVGLWG